MERCALCAPAPWPALSRSGPAPGFRSSSGCLVFSEHRPGRDKTSPRSGSHHSAPIRNGKEEDSEQEEDSISFQLQRKGLFLAFSSAFGRLLFAPHLRVASQLTVLKGSELETCALPQEGEFVEVFEPSWFSLPRTSFLLYLTAQVQAFLYFFPTLFWVTGLSPGLTMSSLVFLFFLFCFCLFFIFVALLLQNLRTFGRN